MTSFTDKIVVITGSTRGLGYAAAQAFLRHGATVVVTGRREEALTAALNALASHGYVHGELLDVTDEAQVHAAVARILKALGRIDIWINNAGYAGPAGAMLEVNPREAAAAFAVNDLGALYSAQAVLPHMLARGQGHFVNIYGRGSFLRPASPNGLYGASKAWLTSFTRTLAKEIRGSGVRVLGFSPGMVRTDMLTRPRVAGDAGRERMQNYGFVLRWLSRPPEYAAGRLVQAVAGQKREFAEVRLFKPWTPLLGMLRVGWENLTRTGTTPEFTLIHEPAYRFKPQADSSPPQGE